MLEALNRKITSIPEHLSIYGVHYALARTLLAVGSMFTLLFDDADFLFNPTYSPNPMGKVSALGKLSLFSIGYPDHLLLAKIVGLFILLLVVSGYRPRITCVLHWWVSMSIYTSAFITEGGDQISMILSLLLIPVCLYDGRKNHWRLAEAPVSPKGIAGTFAAYSAFFFMLLIKLQVTAVYLHASLGKLAVTEWADGTALYYWFTNENLGMPAAMEAVLSPLINNRIPLALATWGVILFEFILGISIFFRRRIKTFLALGIAFHFGIFLIHGLFTFFLAMAGALLLYYMPFYKRKNMPEP